MSNRGIKESTTAMSVGAFPTNFKGGPSSVSVVPDGENFKIIIDDSDSEFEIESGLPKEEAEELAKEYRKMFAPDTLPEGINMGRRDEGETWNRFKGSVKGAVHGAAAGAGVGALAAGPVGAAVGSMAGAVAGRKVGSYTHSSGAKETYQNVVDKVKTVAANSAKKAVNFVKNPQMDESYYESGRQPMLSIDKLIESVTRGANVTEAVRVYLAPRLLEDEDVAQILSPEDTAPGTTLPGVDVEDPEDDAIMEPEIGPTSGIVPDADDAAVDAAVDSTELATKDVDDEEMGSIANSADTVPGEFMEDGTRERYRIRKGVRESLRRMGLISEADGEMPDFLKDKIDGEDKPDQEEDPIEEPKIESRRRRPSLVERLRAAAKRQRLGEEFDYDDEEEFGSDVEPDGDEDDLYYDESNTSRSRRRRRVSEEEGDGSGIAAADRLPGEEMPTSGDDEDNDNEGETPTTPGVSEARKRLKAKLEAHRRRRNRRLSEEEAGMNFPPEKKEDEEGDDKEDGDKESSSTPETHVHVHMEGRRSLKRRARINEEGEAGQIPPEDEYPEDDDVPVGVEEPEEPMESRLARRGGKVRLKENRIPPSVLNEAIDNQFQLGETVSWNGRTGTVMAQNPSALGYYYLVQIKNGPSVQAAHHELSRG